MVRDVSKYLREQEENASGNPGLANEWSKLDDLYSKRLWHQLTRRLMKFVHHSHLQTDRNLIDLYENFIQDFEMRMNPLSFMEIAALLTKQFTSAEESIKFLDKCEPKLKTSKEATALCKITKSQIHLLKNEDKLACKESMEEIEEMLRAMDGVTTVHGRFYLLQSQYNMIMGNTAEYYRSALKFLGCTDMSTLTLEVQRHHAKHLTVAALVAEDIYNFGELLAHPVLNSLRGTPFEWMVVLLKAFNAGNLKEFNRLRPKWATDNTLAQNENLLRVKITLLSLMEMTFKRGATERQLTFQEISDETNLKEDEVEIFVMKAISKGLLKGQIDEVAKKVHMTWVQPRVLDRTQIGGMISRLDHWKQEIFTMETMMEKNAADILLL